MWVHVSVYGIEACDLGTVLRGSDTQMAGDEPGHNALKIMDILSYIPDIMMYLISTYSSMP
jgi:hypothetical protein